MCCDTAAASCPFGLGHLITEVSACNALSLCLGRHPGVRPNQSPPEIEPLKMKSPPNGKQRKRNQLNSQPKHGSAALDQLYRGVRQPGGRPLLFLDFDDVLCLSRPFSGYDVFAPDKPSDLWQRLWHPPAMQTLLTVIEETEPKVIITTNWLRLMDKEGFLNLFLATGLGAVADALHANWEAPQARLATRLQAIEKWLNANYGGESLVVLDDKLSGTGLHGSRLDRAGCVVLCEAGVGLHAGHLPAIRKALCPPAVVDKLGAGKQ